jgi:phosphonate transport system permease protein
LRGIWLKLLLASAVLAIGVQAVIVVQVSPIELVTGMSGIADIAYRSFPPDLAVLPGLLRPAIETVDIALFGTVVGVIVAGPLAVLAAANTSPSPGIYWAARGLIALCRSVPDIVWALLFVASVGLGPFPGALAIGVHSVGMLGRLFAEIIEDIDYIPIRALATTGASRLQIFSHAIVPSLLPSLVGIALYRLDENIRASMVLGFVGAGGLGFQLLTAMSLFQYRTVSILLCLMFLIVTVTERFSQFLRSRLK